MEVKMTMLIVTDANGDKWQLKWSLEEVAKKSGLSKKMAQKHFMHLAKCVREGKVSPESLDAHKVA